MKLSKHELATFIETVHDFPKKGVSFKDLSPLLGRGLLPDLIHYLAESVADVDFDSVGCVEARGFIYGTALAQHLQKKIVLIRKPGKLAPPIFKKTYDLEYGQDALEIKAGSGRVLLVDDVLATGGTLRAAADLCQMAGYTVAGFSVVMDLKFLNNFEWQGLRAHSIYKIED